MHCIHFIQCFLSSPSSSLSIYPKKESKSSPFSLSSKYPYCLLLSYFSIFHSDFYPNSRCYCWSKTKARLQTNFYYYVLAKHNAELDSFGLLHSQLSILIFPFPQNYFLFLTLSLFLVHSSPRCDIVLHIAQHPLSLSLNGNITR